MHVFPYSVRTGTAAARWNQLPSKVVQDRVQQLLSLDEELSLAYRTQLVGRSVQVMLEQSNPDTNLFRGRCEHYAEITLKTNGKQGELVQATVTDVTNDSTLAMQELTILTN
jgi:tRNA A37 methylthiotransferase MiaB